MVLLILFQQGKICSVAKFDCSLAVNGKQKTNSMESVMTGVLVIVVLVLLIVFLVKRV